jgi:allantoicase
MIDLVSHAVGGRVVECNDEFFAEASNLISSTEPEWREGAYTDRGKWMDGWETRRRREPGHDWCILGLGIPGRLERVTVDTSHFTGNYPESFSLEASGGSPDQVGDADWREIIGNTPLRGDSVATFQVEDQHRVTLVRLNIFPDGGVARLRLEGTPIPAMHEVCPDGGTDLVSALVGGIAFDASDRHYSDPANLLRPNPSAGMWDGWETRRRRGPGHDWAVFRLGLPGSIERLIVDTSHFKGNAPGWVSLDISDDTVSWTPIIERHPVRADSVNEMALDEAEAATFARLSIHPDGGVARLRIIGTPDAGAAGASRVSYLNSLFESEARRFFRSACAASAWVSDMVAGRPYESPGDVLQSASSAFDLLTAEDWLEAFAGHPRIGERGDAQANREQAGTASASREIIARLASVNEQYEAKFGFTYIVYATGKSAEEMLDIAETRLESTRREEIAQASQEQRSITETRLRRMLCMERR